MKRFIALLAGTMFIIAVAIVTAGSGLAQTKDTDKKVYQDDDLSKSKMDKDQSTLNQMESEKQGSEGTAAGGIRDKDKGKMKSEGSSEKGTEEPYPPISY